MRGIVIFALALTLAGCGSKLSPAEDAEAQYNITAEAGSSQDRCDQAKKVAQAYLEAKDSTRYLEWKIKQQTDCMDAAAGIEHYSNGQIIEPDNLDAMADTVGE